MHFINNAKEVIKNGIIVYGKTVCIGHNNSNLVGSLFMFELHQHKCLRTNIR